MADNQPTQPKPAEKKLSLPNVKDPQTAAFMEAARSHIKYVKGKPAFVNEFCEVKGCGYPKVERSQFTGDRNHTDLVCGWDPEHSKLPKE